MKAQLFLVLCIITILGFLCTPGFAQSEDSTELSTIADEWQGKLVLTYWGNTKGDSDVGFAVAIPLLTYKKDSEEVASINFLTEFDRHWDITASAKLTPVNKWLKEKIGQNGDISFPVLDIIVTKYVNLEIFVGGGYDRQESCPEYAFGLNILKASF